MKSKGNEKQNTEDRSQKNQAENRFRFILSSVFCLLTPAFRLSGLRS